MNDQQRQRRDKAGGGWNGKSQKMRSRPGQIHGGQTIEPRKPKGATEQVDRCDGDHALARFVPAFAEHARARDVAHHVVAIPCHDQRLARILSLDPQVVVEYDLSAERGAS